MTERITKLRALFVEDKAHRSMRGAPVEWDAFENEIASLTDTEKVTAVFERILSLEAPVIFEDERIPFMRTVYPYPYFIFEKAVKGKSIHENGMLSNICVDFTKLLSCGFERKIEELDAYLHDADAKQALEYSCMKRQLEAILRLTERYAAKAREQGMECLAGVLERVPRYPAESFYEALIMLRIIHYAMWASGAYHNTVGRLDRILLPYFEKDIASGVLTPEGALELLEEFFLGFNKDSDLYIGVQQGDNGQSIVLGGRGADGTTAYNVISELCLKASLSLRVIDPKINLRVDSKTPVSVFKLGTQLTKTGLGFPQYLNDDVNIKALTDWGYSPEDAANYSAAACWEIIIPGKGMEIPNVSGVSLAGAAARAIYEHLASAPDFDTVWSATVAGIREQADAICERARGIYIVPSPLHSLMMEGCVEKGRDVTEGCVYNNYGIHGAGLSAAADMLAAVKRYVFDEQSIGKEELLTALSENFEGHDALYHKLRFNGPKMGSDELADSLGVMLLESFAGVLEGRRNDRGGIYRAGTGSAMFYIKFSEDLPATPDGRRAGEAIPANYSPSLLARADGPVSIIQSFTKPDLSRVANGGPLTLELHDTMFKNPEAIAKTAYLVKSYIDLGGHQLQLNAVNRDLLIDAQKNPDAHRNLIVRVWGWSGYFTELDREYQDHIIARCEYTV